ncbi:MAG TPA: cupin domain-containing protein [Blastocatellia bacterium]|nr:cupin domain-containing protein [Blastocatellia bacterium]
MKSIFLSVVLILTAPSLALGQAERRKADTSGHAQHDRAKMADHGIFAPADVKWVDGPAALPAGAKMAVLEGDPTKPGLFTMRVWLPDGFKVPPHYHPKVERVTVISGTLHLGMGDKFDQAAARAMPAGAFGFLAPRMKHFAWAQGETVIQLNAEGPWQVIYLNPADDPRKMKQ